MDAFLTVHASYIEKSQCDVINGTVACDWAGAVIPENHKKREVIPD